MALVSQCKCKHPRLLKNRYTGKDIFVSCGKCIPCQRARQSAWIAKLQKEAKCHVYTYEIELDYNEDSLPKYDFGDDGTTIVEVTPRLKKYYDKYPHLREIKINDLKFEHDYDRNYFIDRLNTHHTCIPHASVYDIQIFKKRLNTYIKRHITGKYGCVRSAFVSELGGTTIRPHYHGIIYFDDERIVKRIQLAVSKCWTDDRGRALGHSKAAPDRGQFASYLAKYICLPSDIPSFYAHPALRPIFLTSRKPPIGSLFESSAQVRWIFFNASPTNIEFKKQGEFFVPQCFSIGQNIENRLFPKCLSYESLSDPYRIELYKCAHSSEGIKPYNVWLNEFFNRLLEPPYRKRLFSFRFDDPFYKFTRLFNDGKLCLANTSFARVVYSITRNFECERTFQSMYEVSSRIYRQAEIFEISSDCYINYVLKYHNKNKKQAVLRQFYNTQISVLNSYPNYDYEYFYPLTYGQLKPPAEAPDALAYQANQEFLHSQEKKTHEKNEYFESLRVKDNPLYVLLKHYKDAKKCYEVAKAESELRPQRL